MAAFDMHAVTDVTGFGLAGHGYEMASGSQVCLEIEIEKLPLMQEALEMYAKGMSTGVNGHIRKMVEKNTRFDTDLPAWHREIVFDPQTSGGLLAAMPDNQADNLIKALHEAGVSDAKCIGRVKAVEDDALLVFR